MINSSTIRGRQNSDQVKFWSRYGIPSAIKTSQGVSGGGGGGNGAAPLIFHDNISVPTIPTLARAQRQLHIAKPTALS